MTSKQKAAVQEKLAQIKAGKNYPASVVVEETVAGKPLKLCFFLNSFYVGMYCAIHINDATIPHQTGDHNNKSFVSRLKRDLARALERGAEVTIGSIRPCKLDVHEI